MIPTYLEYVLRKSPEELLEEFDPDVKYYSEPGSRFKDSYYPVIDDDGRFDLQKKGVIDVYSDIQSHAESVDINRIISRLQAGDISVLEKHKGFFADISDLPDNYAGFLQKMSDAELIFSELSPEKRALFHNDPYEFISSFGTEKFTSVFKSVSDELSNKSDSADVVKGGDNNE